MIMTTSTPPPTRPTVTAASSSDSSASGFSSLGSASASATPSSAPSAASALTSDLSSLRQYFQQSLRNFSIDPRQQLAVVYTQSSASSHGGIAQAPTPVIPAPTRPRTDTVKTLFILDSSFNPPSRAHGWIAKSAIVQHLQEKQRRRQQRQQQRQHQKNEREGKEEEAMGKEENEENDDDDDGEDTEEEQTRLLLLLATRNADKPSPADKQRQQQQQQLQQQQQSQRIQQPRLREGEFEDRLVMMVGLARDILADIYTTHHDLDPKVVIDIGLTKMPYFVGKAEAIDHSGVYRYQPGGGRGGVEQVHLVGFDTLTRIFERKYYAELGLEVLEPFMARHRLRVLTRPADEDTTGSTAATAAPATQKAKEKLWGNADEQKDWLERMRRGELEELGCKREWAQRIDLVDAKDANVLGVSSTKAREAVGLAKWAEVDRLLTPTVAAWVREAGLYQLEDQYH